MSCGLGVRKEDSPSPVPAVPDHEAVQEFGAAADAVVGVDLLDVAADGVVGQPEVVGDAFGGLAVDQEGQHGLQTGRQGDGRLAVVGGRALLVQPVDLPAEDMQDAGLAPGVGGPIDAAVEHDGRAHVGPVGDLVDRKQALAAQPDLVPADTDIGQRLVVYARADDLRARAGPVPVLLVERVRPRVDRPALALGGDVGQDGELPLVQVVHQRDRHRRRARLDPQHVPHPDIGVGQLGHALDEAALLRDDPACSPGDFGEQTHHQPDIGLGELGFGVVVSHEKGAVKRTGRGRGSIVPDRGFGSTAGAPEGVAAVKLFADSRWPAVNRGPGRGVRGSGWAGFSRVHEG